MRHASNEKWQTTHDGKGRTTKSSCQNARRKGNLQILGKIGNDTIKQMEMKEKKNQKRASQKNQKTTRDKTLSQEPCQRDKYLGCLPCKILGTILDEDQRRTQTNEPENKKTNDHA